MALLLANGLCAQEQGNNALHKNAAGKGGTKAITFPASDVQYWVGSGSNSAVVIVGWDENATPTALVWGVHWNGSTTATGLLDSIVAHDSRFSYSISNSLMQSMAYNDGTLNLQPNPNYIGYWCYYQNGDWGSYAWPNCPVANGDVIEASESCSWTLTTATAVTNPNAQSVEDASIDATDILYWVGEGNNQVVLAVNWADTALAWGYRFSGESTSVSTMMADIANADPRFSYVTGSWGIDDINYNIDNLSLGVTPGNYWWSLLNHIGGMGMGDILHDGDFYKWGDLAVAVITDSTWVDYGGGYAYWDYTYIWPYAITPVSVPNNDPEVGPFCGAVGSEGCTAIAYNDSKIKAWATGCTIVRGSQNLSDPNAPLVTFGSEDDAIGAATTNTMDVVSLGDGGSATLTFAKPIKNGDGFDFAVYENSFNDSFLELAFVEVSSDGINFVRFPATSLTQTNAQIGGNGSVDPTFINNLAGKYRVGYGTPFDLAELADSTGIDINSITHVRIIDVVGSIDPQYGTYDAYGHIINDPFPNNSYSAGFDLDGVAVLNQAGEGFDAIEESIVKIYPNPANEYAIVNCDDHASVVSVEMFDMTGRLVYSRTLEPGTNQFQIGTSRIANGIYMLRIGDNTQKLVVRH